jgi:hypothetical protein
MQLTRLSAVVVALGAAVANACPVCGTPSEQGQGAYLFMTGVMSLLPLLMLGGMVTWVVLRVRRADQQDAVEPDEVVPVEQRPS